MLYIYPGENYRSVLRRQDAVGAQAQARRKRCVSAPTAIVAAVLAAIVISWSDWRTLM